MGISPTKNESDILSAYAEKVKSRHPEDYPEEWRLLHDACQKALRLARGENDQPFVSVKEPEFDDRQNYVPESEYAEEFREALRQNENIAGKVIRTVQDLKKERDVFSSGTLTGLMELLPRLSPGQKENAEAVKEVTEFLADSQLTPEACDMIFPQMQEWYWSCQQTAQRDQIRKVLDSVNRLKKNVRRQKRHRFTDALFAIAASLFFAPYVDEVGFHEYIVFLIEILAIGFGYLKATWKPRYVPREKESRWERVRGLSLFAAGLFFSIGFAVSLVIGEGEIKGRVELPYRNYSPELEEKTPVTASLNGSPIPICTFFSTLQTPDSFGIDNYEDKLREGIGTYYLCEDTGGQQFLLFALMGNDEESQARMTGTVYGKASKIHSTGIFLTLYAEDSDYEPVQGEKMLRTLGEKIGTNPVLYYTGTEPEYISTVIGYKPGHNLFELSATVLTGLGIYLALMFARGIPIRIKKTER